MDNRANRFMVNRRIDAQTDFTLNVTVFYCPVDDGYLVYSTYTKTTFTQPKDRRRKIEIEILECHDTSRQTVANEEIALEIFNRECKRIAGYFRSEIIVMGLFEAVSWSSYWAQELPF